MTGQFDIEIDLNGWLIPIHVEQKGEGIFKVAYGRTTLGILLKNQGSNWSYAQNLLSKGLLNKVTSEKISRAITNY